MSKHVPAAPRAVIIGGSLGGLFTATALQAIGWQVDVFERSPHELDSRGGGLVLQSDVVAAFNFASVKSAAGLGVRSHDRIYLDREDRVVQRSYMPQTQTSWNMLYGAMKRKLPAEVVHPGELFVRFEAVDRKVRAYFASGRVENADLLVGADGVRSAVRAQVLPRIGPRYSGYVAWRGLVPENEMTSRASQMLSGTFAFQQGPEHMILTYMVPGEDESLAVGERRWNWVWYQKIAHGEELRQLLTDSNGIAHAFSLPPGAVKSDDVERLMARSRALLGPTFQDLVGATREPFVQAVLDLQTERMAFDRAVLLGDAAFMPRPHTAGSTAKAAANAVALAGALAAAGADIEPALRTWEQQQLQDGMQMTEWGMSIGDRIMGITRSSVPLNAG